MALCNKLWGSYQISSKDHANVHANVPYPWTPKAGDMTFL
jgi:hypothetical protein